jgi:hypothetical protein
LAASAMDPNLFISMAAWTRFFLSSSGTSSDCLRGFLPELETKGRTLESRPTCEELTTWYFEDPDFIAFLGI